MVLATTICIGVGWTLVVLRIILEAGSLLSAVSIRILGRLRWSLIGQRLPPTRLSTNRMHWANTTIHHRLLVRSLDRTEVGRAN